MGKIAYRKVPDDWEHPKDDQGHFIPLLDGNAFLDHSAHWQIHRAKWDAGLMEVERNGRTVTEPIPDDALAAGFEAIYDQTPDMKYYTTPRLTSHPTGGAWQIYEEVTEGTPISPRFPNFDALVEYVAQHAKSSIHAARSKIVMTIYHGTWDVPVSEYEIGGSRSIPQQ